MDISRDMLKAIVACDEKFRGMCPENCPDYHLDMCSFDRDVFPSRADLARALLNIPDTVSGSDA